MTVNRMRVDYITPGGTRDKEVFEVEAGLLISMEAQQDTASRTGIVRWVFQGDDAPTEETVNDCAAIIAIMAYFYNGG